MIINCNDCIWSDVCSECTDGNGCDDGYPMTEDFIDAEYLCEAQVWIKDEMQYFDGFKGDIEDE